ncbi:MAG: hypothetical protein V2J10_03455, partial [Wenzhouxiangella sp.]|nr:hypothetical protein [Wenzhouxiangella sp.]
MRRNKTNPSSTDSARAAQAHGITQHGSAALASILVATVAVSGALCAAPLAAFEIDSYVISPAGGFASQDDWTLNATLGQSVAGTSEGGPFELRAGFWSAEFIVLPLVDA